MGNPLCVRGVKNTQQQQLRITREEREKERR